LDVFGHDGDPLGVDGTQVGILKEANQISLAGFLKSSNSRALEPQVGLEILSYFTYQPLERQLTDEELSGLLVTTDFPEGYSTRLVTVRFLDTSGGWGALTGSFGGQLLTRSFSSSGFTSCLLCTSHLKTFSELENLNLFN
jgi:hypothetical protein